MKSTLGEKLTPILEEIEGTLWEHQFAGMGKPNFSDTALRAAAKIFMDVMIDKMWELQEEEDIEDRIPMGVKLANDLRKLIKTYTNIDTHDMYKENEA